MKETTLESKMKRCANDGHVPPEDSDPDDQGLGTIARRKRRHCTWGYSIER